MKKLSKQLVNKSEIISELAKNKNISISLATLVFETFFDGITNALKKEQQIQIRGFGSFKLKKYQAYMGKNPKNNETIKVKSKKIPFFKVGNVKYDLN
ncbi:MAG: HU family DNA-binding protein [Bdellovibrionales bacterium]